MCLSRDAAFIQSHEHCVVMILLLVQRMLPCKKRENFGRNAPLLDEVGIYSVHIFVCIRQREFLFFLCTNWLGFRTSQGCIAAEKHPHSLGKGLAVKLLHKANRTAAHLIFVIVPRAAADGDAVVPAAAVRVDQLVLTSGTLQLFAVIPQKFWEIYAVGKQFFFFCKWDVCHEITYIPTIDHRYIGAVSVKIRQANRIIGGVQSSCPCLR